jgi:Aph-1 protein
MTADTVALIWGSGMVAFAPLVCLFFQIAYPKSQLIIVATTSAFFFLLSVLSASVIWYILDPLIGLDSFASSLIPGVVCQFVGRCSFCSLYFKMEHVIEESLEKSEEREHARTQARRRQQQAQAPGPTTGNGTGPAVVEERSSEVDAAKLRLELNDASCGLTAGIGFGGMHAILLYGTLLASESSDFGALYQPSCPYMPTLIVSALHCFFFFILDLFFMALTFFGMRRRLIFPRGGGALRDLDMNTSNAAASPTSTTIRSRSFGGYFGNTRSGGNMALWWAFLGHFVASGVTTFNGFEYGCMFSLSLLPVVTLVIAWGFWSGVSKIYMPLPHSTERLSLPASFSYGDRAEAALNGDDEEEEDDDGDEDTARAVSARVGAEPQSEDWDDSIPPQEDPRGGIKGSGDWDSNLARRAADRLQAAN